MNSYTTLGLVNTKQLFHKALADGYALPAYNFSNLEQLQAILSACAETASPVILQVSASARDYMGPAVLRHLVHGALEDFNAAGVSLPVALHLDHGTTFDLCRRCIDEGFSSVMFDGSRHAFERNIELTAEVAAYAHAHDVSVEGELGVLAGVEDEIHADEAIYTRPRDAAEFVRRTGVDSLAISIGTSHGAVKFKPQQCTRNADGILVPPMLRFEILEAIEEILPGFPIVLHGASSVPADLVDDINAHGGALKDAVGIPDAWLRKAAQSAVCKINIDSDGRLAMTAALRKSFQTHPDEFDPRKYLGRAREAMKQFYIYKNRDVLGSAGRA